MDFDTSKLTPKALEIAKAVSHHVWEKYDDTYGYRSEKQKRNAQADTKNKDSIWFFLNQFDPSNQVEFLLKILAQPESPDRDALFEFVGKYLQWQAGEMEKVRKEHLMSKN